MLLPPIIRPIPAHVLRARLSRSPASTPEARSPNPPPAVSTRARRSVARVASASLVDGLVAPISLGYRQLASRDDGTVRAALITLPQIAAHIENDLGWELDLGRLRVDVVDRDQFFNMAMEDVRVRAGMTKAQWDQANQVEGYAARARAKVSEFAQKRAVLAVYLPSQSRILVVGPNTEDANTNGLREILYHELIHAAQHQNHPAYINEVNALVGRVMRAGEEHGTDSDAYLDLSDSLNARMALLEGHPTYMQTLNRERHFPGADLGTSWSAMLGSALSMLSRDGRNKVAQYMKGQEALQRLYADDPAFIDVLYHKPELVEVLLKTRGTVRVEVSPETTDAELAAIRLDVDRLAAMNPYETHPTVIVERASR